MLCWQTESEDIKGGSETFPQIALNNDLSSSGRRDYFTELFAAFIFQEGFS